MKIYKMERDYGASEIRPKLEMLYDTITHDFHLAFPYTIFLYSLVLAYLGMRYKGGVIISIRPKALL